MLYICIDVLEVRMTDVYYSYLLLSPLLQTLEKYVEVDKVGEHACPCCRHQDFTSLRLVLRLWSKAMNWCLNFRNYVSPLSPISPNSCSGLPIGSLHSLACYSVQSKIPTPGNTLSILSLVLCLLSLVSCLLSLVDIPTTLQLFWVAGHFATRQIVQLPKTFPSISTPPCSFTSYLSHIYMLMAASLQVEDVISEWWKASKREAPSELRSSLSMPTGADGDGCCPANTSQLLLEASLESYAPGQCCRGSQFAAATCKADLIPRPSRCWRYIDLFHCGDKSCKKQVNSLLAVSLCDFRSLLSYCSPRWGFKIHSIFSCL